MTPRTRAIASLWVVVVVWGSTFIITKSVLEDIAPITLAGLRFFIATAVLTPLAMGRGGLAKLPRPLPVGRLALMALTGFAIYYAGFNYALLFTSASQGALIQALGPAAIALAAVVFLREKPSRRRIGGIVLSICGVALVITAAKGTSAAPNPLLGGIFMVAAMLSWAFYTILAKGLAGADQIVVTACVSALGTAMLLPLAAAELAFRPWPSLSAGGWLSVGYLSVVASAGGFYVYNRALRELDASAVGVYINLIPVVGVLTAVIFLGETLQPLQTLGGAITLLGIWLAS
jgi:drug/metabolite transporter (DMT)-like permease